MRNFLRVLLLALVCTEVVSAATVTWVVKACHGNSSSTGHWPARSRPDCKDTATSPRESLPPSDLNAQIAHFLLDGTLVVAGQGSLELSGTRR